MDVIDDPSILLDDCYIVKDMIEQQLLAYEAMLDKAKTGKDHLNWHDPLRNLRSDLNGKIWRLVEDGFEQPFASFKAKVGEHASDKVIDDGRRHIIQNIFSKKFAEFAKSNKKYKHFFTLDKIPSDTPSYKAKPDGFGGIIKTEYFKPVYNWHRILIECISLNQQGQSLFNSIGVDEDVSGMQGDLETLLMHVKTFGDRCSKHSKFGKWRRRELVFFTHAIAGIDLKGAARKILEEMDPSIRRPELLRHLTVDSTYDVVPAFSGWLENRLGVKLRYSMVGKLELVNVGT